MLLIFLSVLVYQLPDLGICISLFLKIITLVFDDDPSIQSIRKNGIDNIVVRTRARNITNANHTRPMKYIALFK